MNKVMDDIKQNSNKLVARISLLYQKLKKVDSSIQPDRSVPKQDIMVTNGASRGFLSQFDSFKGQLKHSNPILEGQIKNPVLSDMEDSGEFDEI
jgi:hypothetical protein